MTAAPDRIGGESEYDRAVVLAEAMGVRVVETTQDSVIERWGCACSAVLIYRSARGQRRLGMDRANEDGLLPGQAGVYLTETRHGDALAVLHELGHAALHAGGPHRCMLDEATIRRQEIEAWCWAMNRLGRELTAAERRDITLCLRSYRVSLKEIRTYVLAS